jgi:hypothetical protein
MNRTKPGALIIRISTRINKRQRQFEVPISHCQEQWTHPIIHGSRRAGITPRTDGILIALQQRIHINASPQQPLNHFDSTFSNGKKHWSKTGVQLRVYIRTSIDQRIDH